MRPTGSSFNIGDTGLFYNILDMGGSKLTGDNKAAIISALTSIAAAGGGILIVPAGVAHTFTSVDFPVTANAICVWEMDGDTFKLIPNKTHTTTLGAILASVRLATPKMIGMELVDVLTDPPTYTFEWKVYDGVSGVSGSTFDVCFFVPGVATPVEAVARAGTTPGRHFFFKGVDITGAATFRDDVSIVAPKTLTVGGAISGSSIAGIVRPGKEIFAPSSGGSTAIAETTEVMVLNHSGTIASYTLTLPSNPVDSQTLTLASRSAVTALTLAAGGGKTIAVGHGTTTLAAGSHIKYIYDSNSAAWYKLD
jgi:hypothetical protein